MLWTGYDRMFYERSAAQFVYYDVLIDKGAQKVGNESTRRIRDKVLMHTPYKCNQRVS
jgi:hypothetical protein